MNSMIYKKKSPLFVFLIPAFAFMSVYLYYPFLRNIYNSFTDIRQLGAAAVGMNDPWYLNYAKLIQDPLMLVALKNTFLIMGATIVFQVGLALILALLVDNITVGAQFFRTVYFFPIVISATALGLMFNLIFLYRGGMINTLITLLSGAEQAIRIDWKDQSRWLSTMVIPVVWQYIGFYFVIIVTGLNNISSDIYEAAQIDGADGIKKIRYVTLPLLYNVLCTCLTLAITGSLKVFDLPFTMLPNGMPMDLSWLTATYMYHQTYNAKNVDYASTIAIVIVILGVVISQVANAILKEKDY